MVDVIPGAAEFDPAITAALTCRHLLNMAGVSDIEVEIREVRPRLFASLDDLQSKLEKRYWLSLPETTTFARSTINEEFVNMLRGFVGFEIGPEDELGTRVGTMGPFLRLAGRDSELYGLTCRHVVHRPVENPGDEAKPWFWLPNDQGYNHETAATPGNHRMIQPGKDALQTLEYHLNECCKAVDEQCKIFERRRTKHFMQGTDLDWPEQSEYDELKRDLAYYSKFQDLFKQSEDPLEPSSFGQIAFMPPLELSNRGFMRDWALIRLDQGTAGPAPSNSVVAGFAEHRFRRDGLELADTQPPSVMLKGIWSSDKINQRQSVTIAKRGMKTGLTFGVTNEIKAVVRTVLGNTVGWEWIVINEDDEKKFSGGGDSGACVFDMSGEVVGLVTSGGTAERVVRRWKKYTEQDESLPVDSGAKESGPVPSGFKGYKDVTDLTFVTPIDKVFEDIEKVTGCKPSLA